MAAAPASPPTEAPPATGGCSRELDRNGGALFLAAGDGNLALVFVDDLFHRRQSQARPGPFGRKVRLEELADVFGGDRRAVVADDDLHHAPSLLGRHGDVQT